MTGSPERQYSGICVERVRHYLMFLLLYILTEEIKPSNNKVQRKFICQRITGDGGFIKVKSFRGGPGLLFYDSLIMNAAHFDFTEH